MASMEHLSTQLEKTKISDSIFELSVIQNNEEGWGPSVAPSKLKGIPFSPFNKGDRIGKVSDWNAPQQRAPARASGAPGDESFTYKHNLDEREFSVVDNQKKPKPKFKRYPRNWVQKRPAFRGGFRGRRTGGRGGADLGRRGGKGYWNPRRRWGFNQFGQQQKKDPSVKIEESWKLIREFDFKELAQASWAEYPTKAEDLVTCGSVKPYAGSYDHIAARSAKPLVRLRNVSHFIPGPSDDDVIKSLQKQKVGNVYSTDTILSVLMAADRSVNGWDVVVEKRGNDLIFDKRADTKVIDFLTVNENYNEVPVTEKDSINHPDRLSYEATSIAHNFSQQVLDDKGKELDFKQKNPFLGSLGKEEVAASVGYRYRKWKLPDNVVLVARTSVNAYSQKSGEQPKFITIRSLNQYDSKVSGVPEWRDKLETQYGAVIATEMTNNAKKLTRWIAEAHLAGTDEMRIGFVSRFSPKDANRHDILAVQKYRPDTLASSARVRMSHLWGVLKEIIDACRKLDDGKYILVKDPNEGKLLLYQVPKDAFTRPEPAASR